MIERSSSVLRKPGTANTPPVGLLQRKCTCGTHTPGGSECAECAKKGRAESFPHNRHLAISQPGDRFEQEADRMAALVMNRHGTVGATSFSYAPSELVQRDDDGKPEPPKPNNYDEAAKKIVDALQETTIGKQLRAKAEELGGEFLASVEGKVVAGSALGSALAVIIATNSKLPVQIPEIPLDFIKPGLKAKLAYEGPVRDPTNVGLTLTSKGGVSVSASYTQTAATPGKPAEKKAGLTLTIPLGGPPAKSTPQGSDSDKYRAETARMAAEQRKFQEGLKTPAQKAQDKADEQRFIDSWMRSRTNDPLNPLRTGKKDDDPLLMRKTTTASADVGVAPPSVHATLAGSGQPLEPGARAFMEQHFGHDFSRVRVHADAGAAESARDVGAHAYTVGSDIVFGSGQYAPHTHTGRELLAHELAHTIQQRGSRGAPPEVAEDSAFESSARAAGQSIAAGKTFSGILPACGVGLSRSPQDTEEEQRRNAAVVAAQALIREWDADGEQGDDPPVKGLSVARFPTTLSLLEPDERFQKMQFTDAQIYGDLDREKAREAAAREAELRKIDEGRTNRLMALRERLRHGYAKSTLIAMLDTLPMRDLQILKHYGLTWPHLYTRPGTFQDSVTHAIDAWAQSSDANTPDPAEYNAILQSERAYYQRNYANYRHYQHKTDALASSSPASLIGRMIGTAIDGEKGGDLGAAIGGLGDAALLAYAGTRDSSGSSGGEAGPEPMEVHGEPPEPTHPTETQPPPVALTDAEVVAANVRNPASMKIESPDAHRQAWRDRGGIGDAPAAFRDGQGRVNASTDHRLYQPATRNVVLPESATGAAKPVSTQARSAPAGKPDSPTHQIELAKTDLAPPQSAVDPLGDTHNALSPKPGPVGPGTADTAPRGEGEFAPPQAVSQEVVRKMQNRPAPAPGTARRGRGSGVNFTIDHEHHQLAWKRLGGHGHAPDAFIYNGQVYLHPRLKGRP